jgi:hypothetical protein
MKLFIIKFSHPLDYIVSLLGSDILSIPCSEPPETYVLPTEQACQTCGLLRLMRFDSVLVLYTICVQKVPISIHFKFQMHVK